MYRLDVTRMAVWYTAPLGKQKRIKHLHKVFLTRKVVDWCDMMIGRHAVTLEDQLMTVPKPEAVIMVFPSETDAMHFRFRWDGPHAHTP